MPRAVGVDLSLTATGLSDGEEARVVKTQPADGVLPTLSRFGLIAASVLTFARRGDVVCIEGPSYGSKGAGTWDRGGLWWHVVDRLASDGLRLVVVPPSTLKAYATGKGGASKGLMADAAARRLPGVQTLGEDNAVDALWLAAVGHQLLGQPLCTLPAAQVARLDVLADQWGGVLTGR